MGILRIHNGFYFYYCDEGERDPVVDPGVIVVPHPSTSTVLINQQFNKMYQADSQDEMEHDEERKKRKYMQDHKETLQLRQHQLDEERKEFVRIQHEKQNQQGPKQYERPPNWKPFSSFTKGPRKDAQIQMTDRAVSARSMDNCEYPTLRPGEAAYKKLDLNMDKQGRSFNWFEGRLPLQPHEAGWYSYFNRSFVDKKNYNNDEDGPYIWDVREPRFDAVQRLKSEAWMELTTDLQENDFKLLLFLLSTTHFRIFYSGENNEMVPHEELRQYFGPGERAIMQMRNFLN
jgi:hypothetical protein